MTNKDDPKKHSLKLCCDGEVVYCSKCWQVTTLAASGGQFRFPATTCNAPTERDKKRRNSMERNGFQDEAFLRMLTGETP